MIFRPNSSYHPNKQLFANNHDTYRNVHSTIQAHYTNEKHIEDKKYDYNGSKKIIASPKEERIKKKSSSAKAGRTKKESFSQTV
jgi:hypothetical protein